MVRLVFFKGSNSCPLLPPPFSVLENGGGDVPPSRKDTGMVCDDILILKEKVAALEA
jgi:hypothetical protein